MAYVKAQFSVLGGIAISIKSNLGLKQDYPVDLAEPCRFYIRYRLMVFNRSDLKNPKEIYIYILLDQKFHCSRSRVIV